MPQKGLVGFFETFLNKESLFREKKVLQSAYTPETIMHRDEQIQQIANILAPALKLEKPSNLFVYGKTGTGKTLSIKYVVDHMRSIAAERNINIKIVYINCKLKKVADTEYRLLAQLAREFGKDIPATGLPTEEIYKLFFSAMEKEKTHLVLVMDEIDQLVKRTGDEILYNLTRINSDLNKSQISLVGVSNDLIFADNLDPRVKSSLSEEEVVFPPYNAVQLQHILRKRAKTAFKDGVLGAGIIEKCAAYAAREHGDARRALELLRVAGEVAERSNCATVEIKHIDEAEDKIERDKIVDVLTTQPKQFQATLYAITLINPEKNVFTGEVYELYKDICTKVGLRPLTQRRVSDVIGELDMQGIVNAKVISKGRYGRTREISIAIPTSLKPKVKKILEESLGI